MKHVFFSLSLMICIILSTQCISQEHDERTGWTTYPNGTIYAPQGEGNKTGSDLVLIPEDGYHSHIDCNADPEACKKALETAADDAENRGSSSNIKDGCGTLDDWRANPGDWPKFPPIFFPDDIGPGIPIPPSRIGAHTDRIIRQIR